jgi:hypothetical protein
MAFLFVPNKLSPTNKNYRFSIYLHFLGIMCALINLLENCMISRIARLALASLVAASIALSPLSVLAADPAPVSVPEVAPAPVAAPADKADVKKAKKQAKQQKKAEKKAKKKSKKKAKSAEAAAQ